MERKTLEANREARDYAVLVGLRSPVLGEDSADEESLMELSELVETAGGQSVGMILQSREKPDPLQLHRRGQGGGGQAHGGKRKGHHGDL